MRFPHHSKQAAVVAAFSALFAFAVHIPYCLFCVLLTPLSRLQWWLPSQHPLLLLNTPLTALCVFAYHFAHHVCSSQAAVVAAFSQHPLLWMPEKKMETKLPSHG